jgi:hypothetical protein
MRSSGTLPSLATCFLVLTSATSVALAGKGGLITPVGVIAAYPAIQVIEATKVDGVEQSFYVDFYMSFFWQDLGLAELTADTALTDDQIANLTVPIDCEFINKKELDIAYLTHFAYTNRPTLLVKSEVADQFPGYPWIERQGRFSGNFKAKLNLQDFPFDRQTIEIKVETVSWPTNYLRFAGSEHWDGNADFISNLDMIEWTIEGRSSTVSQTYYAQWDMFYDRITWMVQVSRRPEYYVNKIITGIAMLTIMSHLAFAIDVADPDRSGIALSCFMGLVTYLFVISADVPKVAYTTRMDSFVSLSFFTIFFDFVFSIVLYAVQHKADTQQADAETAAAIAEDAAMPPTAKYDHDPDLPNIVGVPDAPQQYVRGWWTTWRKHRRVLDFFLTFMMLLGYTIGATVLLRG